MPRMIVLTVSSWQSALTNSGGQTSRPPELGRASLTWHSLSMCSPVVSWAGSASMDRMLVLDALAYKQRLQKVELLDSTESTDESYDNAMT